MKPAAFRYCRPDCAEEARELLREHGADARILAGGQSMVPLMNMRILQPRVVIDINRCRDLSYLREEGGVVACGALARQGEAEESALVGMRLPLLHAALPHVGVRASRNFGTLCGSLAHADPLGELPGVAKALEARFVIASARGVREVGAEEFFVAALTNCLEPDEMVAEVRFPVGGPPSVDVFLEIANRAHGFAVVGLALSVVVAADGRIGRARLAALGAGDTALRLSGVEALIEGQALDAEVIAEARDLAAAEADPPDDVHADSGYRRQALAALVGRALGQVQEAASRDAAPGAGLKP